MGPVGTEVRAEDEPDGVGEEEDASGELEGGGADVEEVEQPRGRAARDDADGDRRAGGDEGDGAELPDRVGLGEAGEGEEDLRGATTEKNVMKAAEKVKGFTAGIMGWSGDSARIS